MLIPSQKMIVYNQTQNKPEQIPGHEINLMYSMELQWTTAGIQ